ncbi:hypothetical protein EVA_16501, partial [gut metagenome]
NHKQTIDSNSSKEHLLTNEATPYFPGKV